MLFRLVIIIYCTVTTGSLRIDKWYNENDEQLSSVINSITGKIPQKSNECIVFILDPFYRRLPIEYSWNKNDNPHYIIGIRENDILNSPRDRIHIMLRETKNSGCNVYIILITNGLQVIQLLQYAERERLLNINGYFILIYDERLFHSKMKYIWNRVINVVFIHQFNVLIQTKSNELTRKQWFNLETVSYPIHSNSFIITYYLDTWYKEQFQHDYDFFSDKVKNLRKKKLRIAIFEHTPAVTKYSRMMYNNSQKYSDKAMGIEFEIIRILANKINFRPMFYRPKNIENDKWGTADENGNYNGLLGEAIQQNAAFLLGDLHYTLRHYKILELSYPYNTECLTFLTPESLTDNSWKLLIIPFRLYTWIAVILILVVAAYLLYFFAVFYQRQIMPFKKRDTVQVSNVTILLFDQVKYTQRQNNIDEQLKGCTLFNDAKNSLLYTYGMLLQVSLPRLPRIWALRLFIGWWWLYGILVTVAYRASMTATLANPVARVTIDTIAQLAKSSITVGGWGEDKRDLFVSSLDKDMNTIGQKFELFDNEEKVASAKVANGTFGYYENIYVLQEARAKRQMLEVKKNQKAMKNNEKFITTRNLHIMQECVIYMPISIGMDRNSPLKPQVDPIIRRIVESGLVEKWLSDVIEWSKISEIRHDIVESKALMDLHKLYGALVALGIGYFFGFAILGVEKLYWKYVVMKNPAYDKYQMDIFYATMRRLKK